MNADHAPGLSTFADLRVGRRFAAVPTLGPHSGEVLRELADRVCGAGPTNP